MMNAVNLVGRMATDPELKYTQSGVPVTSFRIAVQRPHFTAKDGEKPEADFIDIVAWRNNAEFAANYLTKGRLISVQGRLQIRKWTAQDGTARRTAEVVVSDLQALDYPRNNTGAEVQRAFGDNTSMPIPQLAAVGAGNAPTLDLSFEDPFADGG